MVKRFNGAVTGCWKRLEYRNPSFRAERSGDPGSILHWKFRKILRTEGQAAELGGPFRAAASAKRASAGSDLAPVFFMIEARWFSTVR